MTAGASGTILTNPLWVVKTRFMTQDAKDGDVRYRHTWDALIRIYREEGPRAFYRGMLPSLFGVAHVAVQFPLYERFKVLSRESWPFPPHRIERTSLVLTVPTLPGPADGSDIPSSTILLCSSASKMIASIATYPHEVLRTRLQIQKHRLEAAAASSSSSSPAAPFEGIVKTSARIVREEGFAGFYRGMGTNLLRTVPSSAVTILTYELLMRRLVRATGGGGDSRHD